MLVASMDKKNPSYLQETQIQNHNFKQENQNHLSIKAQTSRNYTVITGGLFSHFKRTKFQLLLLFEMKLKSAFSNLPLEINAFDRHSQNLNSQSKI